MGERLPLEARLYLALKRIASYDPPERMHRNARKDYGLDAKEAIEMAYENMIDEAKAALKGVRRPQSLRDGGGQT